MSELLSESSVEPCKPQCYHSCMMASTKMDSSPELFSDMPAADQERRRDLRVFLMDARARLSTADVGLPGTKRRRVQGLRRGEVAELTGVTADWYRWFECGQVRVSARFILRLVIALKLNGQQALTLYRLSIPEIYIATWTTETPSLPLSYLAA
jgi:Helix-turn-helix domain